MVMKQARYVTLLIAIIFVGVLAAGCTKDDAAKQHMLDALEKQEQITSHSYSGELNLDLEALPVETSGQPYTEILLQSLKQGAVSWKGAEDNTLNRREAEISFTTSDGSSMFTVPVIQDSNTIYVHIPLINTEGEYFTLPAIQPLNGLDQTVLQAFTRFTESMDSKWFTSVEQDNGDRLIQLVIEEDTWLPFLMKVNEAFPGMIEEIQNGGFISESQVEALKEDWNQLAEQRGQNIRLTEGTSAYVYATVNPEGYITELEAALDMEIDNDAGSSDRYAFDVQMSWEQINGEQEFTRTVPELTVPFTEILQLIP